jgi:hypothetical protein
MIADGLYRDGWSWGVMGYITRDGRKMHCVDAHRDGKRYVVHAEEFGTAFLELEAQVSRGKGSPAAYRRDWLTYSKVNVI